MFPLFIFINYFLPQVLFNDWDTAKKTLQTKDPRMQKNLGRQVKNFDSDKWNEKCKEIVKKGNTAKVIILYT